MLNLTTNVGPAARTVLTQSISSRPGVTAIHSALSKHATTTTAKAENSFLCVPRLDNLCHAVLVRMFRNMKPEVCLNAKGVNDRFVFFRLTNILKLQEVLIRTPN